MSLRDGVTERKTFVGGVLVLVPAALLSKVIGLFFKIPLLHVVGVEGMAYFLAAYHVYTALFVLSAAALPTALSLVVSRAVARGEEGSVGRIFRVALTVFLLAGAAGSLALAFGARGFAAALSIKGAAPSAVAISPALTLAAFIGAARGFFQGQGKMLPTALSELTESVGKLGFGLLFSKLAKSRGADTPQIAAAAVFGITAGLFLSALLLFCLLLRARRNGARNRPASSPPLPRRRAVLRSLMKEVLPITASTFVMSLVSLADTALISRRLQAAGFAAATANAMYSSYGNLAVPLYNLVPSLLSPVTLSLVPLAAAAFTAHDPAAARTVLSSALHVHALAAIPASLALAVFARPILSLLYGGEEEAVALAAPLLSLLAVAVLPATLLSLTGAALQAMHHPMIPVAATAAGAALKLGTEAVLLVRPAVGLFGAPISTLCCNVVILAIETAALARLLPFRFLSEGGMFRSLAAALLAVGGGIALFFAAPRIPEAPRTLLSLGAVGVSFLFLSLRFRAVGREDILALPAGARVYRILKKYKLM